MWRNNSNALLVSSRFLLAYTSTFRNISLSLLVRIKLGVLTTSLFVVDPLIESPGEVDADSGVSSVSWPSLPPLLDKKTERSLNAWPVMT